MGQEGPAAAEPGETENASTASHGSIRTPRRRTNVQPGGSLGTEPVPWRVTNDRRDVAKRRIPKARAPWQWTMSGFHDRTSERISRTDRMMPGTSRAVDGIDTSSMTSPTGGSSSESSWRYGTAILTSQPRSRNQAAWAIAR